MGVWGFGVSGSGLAFRFGVSRVQGLGFRLSEFACRVRIVGLGVGV